jgi:hypothetical protein
MRRAAKIDSNQNEVVKQLRQIPGVTVQITSQLGNGFVDLVIGRAGVNYLIELKDGSKVKSKQKLTPDELEFHSTWTGQKAVCNSLDEVLKVINIKN